jgi:hypothetical protein
MSLPLATAASQPWSCPEWWLVTTEILPFELEGTIFFALNVLRRVPALDVERSILKLFANGQINKVSSYAFFAQIVEQESIFRILQA